MGFRIKLNISRNFAQLNIYKQISEIVKISNFHHIQILYSFNDYKIRGLTFLNKPALFTRLYTDFIYILYTIDHIDRTI